MYSVYVVQLSSDVLAERRFRSENPGYQPGGECYYVGSTAEPPEDRVRRHLAGYQANEYVRRYFVRSRPDIYQKFLPEFRRRNIEEKERQVAQLLRRQGNAVWQR